MSKQTAVEYLIYEIFTIKRWMPLTPGELNDIIEKAKEMERVQTKDFFKAGFSKGFASDIISMHKLPKEKEKLFDKYYNETFNK